MGNNIIKKINFQDMQYCVNVKDYIIITTLKEGNDNCLIKNTVGVNEETELLNKYLSNNKNKNIIIYGMNSNDNSIIKKYNQLTNLGFTNVYLYTGGMFEWLLLQEIYGKDEFETNTYELDLLKYKGDNNILSNKSGNYF
jgi:rhodanese-related sulfurtransferase